VLGRAQRFVVPRGRRFLQHERANRDHRRPLSVVDLRPTSAPRRAARRGTRARIWNRAAGSFASAVAMSWSTAIGNLSFDSRDGGSGSSWQIL
jgi:hypothetical protein